MTYYNLMNIINDLLNGSEITVNNKICIMNMYNLIKKDYSIGVQIFNMLYFYDIIKEDSGNLETGESNFVLDLDDYRIPKLNKIIVLINRMNDPIHNINTIFKIEYLEILNILKLKYERKNKLIRLSQ